MRMVLSDSFLKGRIHKVKVATVEKPSKHYLNQKTEVNIISDVMFISCTL